jgi:hypothetical protein
VVNNTNKESAFHLKMEEDHVSEKLLLKEPVTETHALTSLRNRNKRKPKEKLNFK